MQYRCRDKIIITGPVSTGTTVLLELFFYLGFDVGFTEKQIQDKINADMNKGLEFEVDELTKEEFREYRVRYNWDPSPEVIKRPFSKTYNGKYYEQLINKYIEEYGWGIKHIFFTVRDFDNWQKSISRDIDKFNNKENQKKKMHKMTDIATWSLYLNLYEVVKRDINFTFIEYPRFCFDRDYGYFKLLPILKNKDRKFYNKAFDKVVKPERITR